MKTTFRAALVTSFVLSAAALVTGCAANPTGGSTGEGVGTTREAQNNCLGQTCTGGGGSGPTCADPYQVCRNYWGNSHPAAYGGLLDMLQTGTWATQNDPNNPDPNVYSMEQSLISNLSLSVTPDVLAQASGSDYFYGISIGSSQVSLVESLMAPYLSDPTVSPEIMLCTTTIYVPQGSRCVAKSGGTTYIADWDPHCGSAGCAQ